MSERCGGGRRRRRRRRGCPEAARAVQLQTAPLCHSHAETDSRQVSSPWMQSGCRQACLIDGGLVSLGPADPCSLNRRVLPVTALLRVQFARIARHDDDHEAWTFAAATAQQTSSPPCPHSQEVTQEVLDTRELGSRGEVWFAAQVVLALAVVFVSAGRGRGKGEEVRRAGLPCPAAGCAFQPYRSPACSAARSPAWSAPLPQYLAAHSFSCLCCSRLASCGRFWRVPAGWPWLPAWG